MNHSIITLLSDLGTHNVSVAVAKAILLQYAPGATLVDVSHKVADYDVQQAAYILQSAYRHYPAGTVHVALVDVFAGNHPVMLLARKDGYFFIAPDNGLLSLAFGDSLSDIRVCHRFQKPFPFHEWLRTAGRVISDLPAAGAIGFDQSVMTVVPAARQPVMLPDGLECNILFIDRFGNVVLDITGEKFGALLSEFMFRIRIMRLGDITSLSSNYHDVPAGKPLCRINTGGYLEIAVNRGAAAELMGLGSAASGDLRYRTVKIVLEKKQETAQHEDA